MHAFGSRVVQREVFIELFSPATDGPSSDREQSNRLHLTLIHQMACCEQSEYRIAVKALQIEIRYFCHLLFSVQYLKFVRRVILLQCDDHYDIRLKTN